MKKIIDIIIYGSKRKWQKINRKKKIIDFNHAVYAKGLCTYDEFINATANDSIFVFPAYYEFAKITKDISRLIDTQLVDLNTYNLKI